MQDLRYYKVMADYNYWMNIKILSICSEIPEDILRKDMGVPFRSIHGSLNHILWSDRIWLARFHSQPVTDTSTQTILYESFDELRQAREQTDRDIQQWVDEMTVEWLKSPFSFVSVTDGQTRTLPAWVLAVHLFNHQVHHRGQITALLSQFGYEFGVTDLPWLPSLQALDVE